MYLYIYETVATQYDSICVAMTKIGSNQLALLCPVNWNDWNVRRYVAQNADTSADVLELLSRDENRYVREAVADNENTPAAVLVELSKDKDLFVREAVAFNENTPTTTLEFLSKDKDSRVLLAVQIVRSPYFKR